MLLQSLPGDSGASAVLTPDVQDRAARHYVPDFLRRQLCHKLLLAPELQHLAEENSHEKDKHRQAAPPQLLEWCHLSSAQLLDVAAPSFCAWCVRAPNL